MTLTHALVPNMVSRGTGHVVNIGSIAGSYPYPGGNVYGATKAFIQHFTRNLQADLAGKGVRVTDIQPGLVGNTEFFDVRFGGDKARAEQAKAGFRGLTAEDIADAVAWVLDRPPHVTVTQMEVFPSDQGFSALTLQKRHA
jgi:3-hydroxy acid dehydrogenase/malonic semialdehyde reductase